MYGRKKHDIWGTYIPPDKRGAKDYRYMNQQSNSIVNYENGDDNESKGDGDPPDGGDGKDKKKDKTSNVLNTVNWYASITGMFSYAEYGIMNSPHYWNGTLKTVKGTSAKFYYRTSKQFTNALDAAGSAKWFKTLGRWTGYISGGLYAIKAGKDFNNGNYIDCTGNLISGGMSVYTVRGGALGMYFGTVYSVINETVGWREMGRRQYQITQNNSSWWRVYAH